VEAGVPGTPVFTEPEICDTVRLNWTASTGEVEGYIVYRDGVVIDTVATTSYGDTSVNDSYEHLYSLRAYNSFCGNSTLTAAVGGWLLPLVIADPDLGDTLTCGHTVQVPVTYCLPIDSIVFDLSVNSGPYSIHLATTLPSVTPDTLEFVVPVIDSSTVTHPDCRARIRVFSGTRIDTLYTDQFVHYCDLAADEVALEIPREFFLDQNYPNPFNPATTIRFGVPRASMVTIEVFDILGRVAATLADGRLQPGIHNVIWNCSGCPSGMYIIRMKTDDRVFLRKMLLMK